MRTAVTQSASATATTAAPTPKKLTKKELAEQAARDRATKAKEAGEAREAAKEAKQAEATAKASKEHAAEAASAENAKKLVEVWKQEPAEASDSDVLSIQSHLLSLSHKCSQDIPTLAGYVNSGVEILKKSGIKETPVEIAAGLDRAAPGKNVAPDCRGILAALLVLIEKG
jgi:hypothetical protein